MRAMGVAACAIVLAAALCAGCASTGPKPGPLVTEDDNYAEKMFKKLGRGTVNVVTGPLEIPNQAANYAHESESLLPGSAAFLGGAFIGTGWCAARVLSGVFDVATFFIPPFQPLMDPEFITSEIPMESKT